MKQKLYPVSRAIDYTATQTFCVLAESAEAAEEQLDTFCERTDWSPDAAKLHGVVQLGDELEQIENSCEVSVGDPVAAAALATDGSMSQLVKEGKAAAMFELLQKIALRPQMYTAPLADLGMEVKAFVEAMEASIAEPGQQLVLLTAVVARKKR